MKKAAIQKLKANYSKSRECNKILQNELDASKRLNDSMTSLIQNMIDENTFVMLEVKQFLTSQAPIKKGKKNELRRRSKIPRRDKKAKSRPHLVS